MEEEGEGQQEGAGRGGLRAGLSPRGYGLAALSAAAVAVGSIPGMDRLLSAGLGLAGFLAVYRALAAVLALAAERVEATRLVEGGGREGEPHRVVLRLCNPTPIPLPGLVVEDEAPPDIYPRPPRFLAPLPPRGCAELEYTVNPRLGVNRWGRPRLRLEDPLGLVAPHDTRVRAAGASRLEARPRIHAEAAAELSRIIAGLAAAGHPAARAGRGTVFLELREYHPDDDPRLIDWKASARTGRLLVKVLEAEEAAAVLLVLHLPPWSLEARGAGDTAGEAAARLAATLAAALASRGALVRLLAVGPGGVGDTGWLASPVAAAREAGHAAARAAGGRRGVPPPLLDALEQRLEASKRPGIALLVTPGGVEAVEALELLALVTRGRAAAATSPPGEPPAPGQLERWRRERERLAKALRGRLVEAAPGGRPTRAMAALLARALLAPTVAARGGESLFNPLLRR